MTSLWARKNRFYYPHFAVEETGLEDGGDLPKITYIGNINGTWSRCLYSSASFSVKGLCISTLEQWK